MLVTPEPFPATAAGSNYPSANVSDPDPGIPESVAALPDERDYVRAYVPRQPKPLPAPIRAALGEKPARMTPEEIAQVIALEGAGHTRAEIAALLDRTVRQVDAARKKGSAKDILKAHESDLTREWIRSAKVAARRGRHEPAQAALEAIGAVESQRGGSGTTVQVNVGIALPGTPGGDRER